MIMIPSSPVAPAITDMFIRWRDGGKDYEESAVKISEALGFGAALFGVPLGSVAPILRAYLDELRRVYGR